MSDATFRNSVLAAVAVGAIAVLLAVVGWTVFEFDPALVVYAQALIVSLSLTVYRFSIWLHRPPTLVLFRRSIQMAKRSNYVSLGKHLIFRCAEYFALNRFVWKRARNRWAAHWPIAIGCVMAMAIVVPLIFGWVWFETPASDLHSYNVMVFGMHVRTIPIDGIEAFLMFHGLVWASFPVIVGTSFAMLRRMGDRGDRATQTFGNDLVPLLLLQAISISGLLMTLSYSYFAGVWHRPLTIFHCVVVVGTVLWLPFSKLFHIPQRSLKLAQMIYEHESVKDGRANCMRCGNTFADQAQITDLIEIEQRLGYRYALEDGTHYQSVCPPCRRATMVLAQSKRWRNACSQKHAEQQTV
ncbi:MAG: hypothetical protein KDB27_33735 [Planctomycetales bacterium]|nr:hypothetical protein [Planctomycetales bacterium]